MKAIFAETVFLLFATMSWTSFAQTSIAIEPLDSTLHPYDLSGTKGRYVGGFIHLALAQVDVDQQWNCLICDSSPTWEEAKLLDKKSIGNASSVLKVRLHKNARWADGTQITSWDIRFSLELEQARSNNVRSEIQSIIINDKDASEFFVVFKRKTFDFLQYLAFPIIPASIEEQIWIESGKSLNEYIKKSKYSTEPFLASLYAGPYTPNGHTGNEWKLRSNERFIKGKPKLSELVLRELTTTRGAAIASVDVVPESYRSEQTSRDESSMKNNGKDVVQAVTNSCDVLIFNLRNPDFTDRRVRQAIAQLIDREGIAKTVNRAVSIDPPQNVPFALPTWPWKHQAEQASQLFKYLRWKPNAAGLRERDGHILETSITTNQSSPHRASVTEKLIAAFAASGIRSSKQLQSDDTFFRTTINRADFPSLALAGWHLGDAVIPYSFFHSSQMPSNENNYAGQNASGWHIAESDESLQNMIKASDTAAFIAAHQTFWKLFATEIPAIPLYWYEAVAHIPADLKAYKVAINEHTPSSSLSYLWTR
jgi:peptide/nickel transport system substrate-binding protein